MYVYPVMGEPPVVALSPITTAAVLTEGYDTPTVGADGAAIAVIGPKYADDGDVPVKVVDLTYT